MKIIFTFCFCKDWRDLFNMNQYIFCIIWTGVVALISRVFNVYHTEIVERKKVRRVSLAFAFLAFFPLIYIAGVRTSFIDTGSYIEGFHNLPGTLNGIIGYLSEVEKDKGFTLLSVGIKSVFGDNATMYLFILALFQGISLIVVYRKYSPDYVMALFLFVASTDYLSWMHNGVRQFMAVTIIFAATGLLMKKKYLPLVLIILVAATMHASALLMIPIVFVVQGKPWNKKTLLAIAAVILAMIFVDKFTNILDILLSDTQYTNVVSDWQAGNDDGTNPLRVLVYSIPTILSLIGLRYIKMENDPIINVACNMGIVATALYCLSGVTSGIFIGRLPIYCSLYSNGILLPWEIKNMFTKESSRLITIIMICGYLLFYYYQTHFVWGLI